MSLYCIVKKLKYGNALLHYDERTSKIEKCRPILLLA